MARFFLPPPTKRNDLTDALCEAYNGSDAEYAHLSLYWAFCHWFLRGLRNFQPHRFVRGVPNLPQRDAAQRRRVRYEKALVQAETEMGRILGIDLDPAVVRRPGIGLDNIREDAVSQALLDDCAPGMLTPQLQLTQAYHLVAYGTVGSLVCQPEYVQRLWRPSLHLIPAWELRPLPSSISGLEQLGGVCWHRWVPIDWLRRRYKGIIKVPKNIDESAARAAAYGSNIAEDGSPISQAAIFGGVGGPSNGSYLRYNKGDDNSRAGSTQYGQLREWWCFADYDHVSRYILQIGDTAPLVDLDYTTDEWQEKLEGKLPPVPINIGRYYEVGSFWGRSFVDRQIPINRELEMLFGDWLDNLRTVDRLRLLAIPSTMGITLNSLAESRKNKVVFYRPDMSAPALKPEVIGPPNSGDAMGKSIGLLSNAMNETSAQGDLVYGGVPKRLESARALAVVGQYQNLPIAVVGQSLEAMYRGVWRATLGYARFQSTHSSDPITIAVRRLDEMCVGLAIDPKTGLATISRYPLPEPSSIELTIRSKQPRTQDLMEEKLLAYRKEGLLTTTETLIQLVRERVDGPRVDRAPFYNYCVAWLENSVLYGDGKTPGKITYQELGENHLIHYLYIKELICSPAYYAASPEVKKVLVAHMQYHETHLAQLPEGMPPLDAMGRPQQLNAEMMAAGGQMPPMGLDTNLNQLQLGAGGGAGQPGGPEGAGGY